jgi:hypothetical protein
MARKITNKLLNMIEEGQLDPMDVIAACFKYMPESEVAEMATLNEFIPEEEEEDEQEDLVDLYEKGISNDEEEEEEEEEEDEDDY